MGFAAVLGEVGADPPTRVVDLGSGGGIPALVLAEHWDLSTWVLVESMGRRAQWLRSAVRTLGWADRIEVVGLRAESVAHERRGWADLVTARGFGVPAATAECAAACLRVGGHLVVSEPPQGDPARCPASGLLEVGMEPLAHAPGPPAFAVIRLRQPCDPRYPRRAGFPTKRPLF